MKNRIVLAVVLGIGLGAGSGGWAAPAVPTAAAPTFDVSPDDTNATVITSTRLSFDPQKHFAVFEENVVVTDPDMKLTSDTLTVVFTTDNKNMSSLDAKGHVVIVSKELNAVAAHAVYDVKDGKVVMTGNPIIKQGKDWVSSERVTFWKATNRMAFEGNVKLVIYSDQDMRRQMKQDKR